ncbi:transposase [Embleya sp. NPDC020630]|uniref:transposase n=1 Tax=Embleya sp. NPDC020630 TaxID=3363979 RepID=UPI0037A310F6
MASDGYRLLEAVLAEGAPGWLREMPAVSTLRTLWLQQFTRVVTDGTEDVAWRGRDDLPPGGSLIALPYDPHVRYSRKGELTWIGYKVHVSECFAGPEDTEQPHLITHVVTTDATVNDAKVVDTVHDRLSDKDPMPREHLLDAGYTSAELLMTAPVTHGVTIVGPVRGNRTRQFVRAEGYDKDSFTIDWDTKRATCPNGAVSRYWTEGSDHNRRPAIRIRFLATTCAPCPARDKCTRSELYGRQLTVRPRDQDALLQRARAEQDTADWRTRYAARAGVESTIHQTVAVAAAGTRKTRYIGLAKTHLAHVLTAAAVNLIRLDAWWIGTPLASTRTSHLPALELVA